MSKKGLAYTLVIAIILLVAVAVTSGDEIWRAAYPYLPRRVQAAPYVIRSSLRAAATPIPLPTPHPVAALQGASTTNAARPTGGASSQVLGGASSQVPGGASSQVPGAASSQAPGAAPSASPGTLGQLPSDAVQMLTPPPDPLVDLPPAVALAAPPQQYQTWNNCGPATLAMALTALGTVVTQAQAATTLKPDPDDKNVSPNELAEYARTYGYESRVRTGGTVDELRALLAAGLPVIVETWFIPTPGDEMGHYLVLHGYDASGESGAFTASDSYEGPGRILPFAEFDDLWRVFNRTYIALYPPERATDVVRVWGASAADEAMHERAEAVARDEVATRGDAFAWFNLGSSLAAQGDPEAATAFDQARALTLPWRMMWYQFGAFEAYAAAGRWEDVRALATANLANAPNLEESHFWIGRAAEAAGDAASARASYETARELNPNYAAAVEALTRLAADGR